MAARVQPGLLRVVAALNVARARVQCGLEGGGLPIGTLMSNQYTAESVCVEDR